MHVILSARAVWAATKDAEVIEKARTASMMARKSRVGIETYCDGGAVALGPTTYVGAMVLGAKGSGGAEEAGAEGSGAVEAGAKTEDVGI